MKKFVVILFFFPTLAWSSGTCYVDLIQKDTKKIFANFRDKYVTQISQKDISFFDCVNLVRQEYLQQRKLNVYNQPGMQLYSESSFFENSGFFKSQIHIEQLDYNLKTFDLTFSNLVHVSNTSYLGTEPVFSIDECRTTFPPASAAGYNFANRAYAIGVDHWQNFNHKAVQVPDLSSCFRYSLGIWNMNLRNSFAKNYFRNSFLHKFWEESPLFSTEISIYLRMPGAPSLKNIERVMQIDSRIE